MDFSKKIRLMSGADKKLSDSESLRLAKLIVSSPKSEEMISDVMAALVVAPSSEFVSSLSERLESYCSG